MFCPKCGVEYREGFTTCADCHVALVDASPPNDVPSRDDAHWADLVTVFESNNPATCAFVESVLQAAEIEYAVMDQGIQQSSEAFFFPIRIQVERSQAEQAKELLVDVSPALYPVYIDPNSRNDED